MNDGQDDRSRRVTIIGNAGYKAASDAMDEITDKEPLTDEEATATFVAALIWPGVNYLVHIGASKTDVLGAISELYDQLSEEDTSGMN